MWFDESVFYQIYPLGFCGAERVNGFGRTVRRLEKIREEIPRLAELGVGAVLLNPLFESESHGYDTVDFFTVDRRLGTNEELKSLIAAFRARGIRVVFDAVFNHVGRKFFAFQEVLKRREETDYRFWFNIDFWGNSAYNDGLNYKNWEGHPELVALRLECADVQNYLLKALGYWIDEFGIDGIRLDVSYLLPPWFLEMIHTYARAKKPDFFLLGEVIHLDACRQNVSSARLDSITNYESFRSMISAFNSYNLFEIEYSLTRLFGSFEWTLFRGKNLFSFADNHDVERAATALKEGRDLKNLYTLLFTMPGIPCIYYGSEYGVRGDKRDGDASLRPPMDAIPRENEDLYAHIARLIKIRNEHPALAYGSYRKAAVTSASLAFVREGCGEKLIIAINIGAEACSLCVEEGEGRDLMTGERKNMNEIYLPPFTAAVCLKT